MPSEMPRAVIHEAAEDSKKKKKEIVIYSNFSFSPENNCKNNRKNVTISSRYMRYTTRPLINRSKKRQICFL